MQDSSTPNPSDPEKDQDNSDTQPKRKLKLKRIVFENEELNTENVQNVEPVPEAQAWEEPEEPPVPEEFRKATGHGEADKSTEDQVPKIQIPGEDEIPVIDPTADLDNENQQEGAAPPVRPASPRPQPIPEAPPVSIVRRLSYILAPVFLLAAIGFLALKFFDPFGKDLPAIQPQDQPVISDSFNESPMPVPAEEDDLTSGLAISNEFTEIETNSQAVAKYLESLQKHRLFVSETPRGLFVGSVFIPEGKSINPELGLTLQSIGTIPGESFAVIASEEGETFPLIIDPL